MGAAEATLGRLVGANNARMRRAALDRDAPNPRALAGVAWNDALVAAAPQLRAEWARFVDGGGTLPRMEDLIDEHQGNDGAWRAGLLVSRGRPVAALADRFPRTLAAVLAVPGIWSGLWSVLEPGSELPEHVGPNAGVLRYHLGISCGADAALSVGPVTTPYRDDEAILFDDTVPHAAWNHGTDDRVTLFLEILRPAPPRVAAANRAVQHLLAQDPRYRRAPGRAAAWDAALNG